ncbi:hypothetical protein FSARC_11356 [Fusarium sarcochroum]|uniref:Bulb-type lectin domain-containing protein n=1 Tax=Fusarium sarcochroum TaxID=1208366 RepID=A0A8H4X0Z4_9HYPO|nr:hypothetical protein FSARC_11356 [Fusarium sarcochroum]
MGGDRLENGEWLLVGNSLYSEDGSVEFRMQDDGKIAVYHDDYCAWQNTPEQTDDIHGVKMQEDGNFVMYDNSGTGNATWHTDTASPTGNNTTTLVVQDDGNVVLYNEGGVPIWATSSNK